jgi:DNA-binding GntR family transcriptional regulator
MSDFLITQAGGFERRFREATKEHADVIDRIERKAASGARLAMETHIQNFARAVRDLLNARSGQRERSPLKNTRHTG